MVWATHEEIGFAMGFIRRLTRQFRTDGPAKRDVRRLTRGRRFYR